MDYYSYKGNYEIRKCESSNFDLFLQGCIVFSGVLHFYLNFRFNLSISTEKSVGILIFLLNWWINLDRNALQIMFNLPIHEPEMFILNLILSVLFFWGYCKWNCFPNLILWLLIVYRNTIGFIKWYCGLWFCWTCLLVLLFWGVFLGILYM